MWSDLATRFRILRIRGPAWIRRAAPVLWAALGVGGAVVAGRLMPLDQPITVRSGTWLHIGAFGVLAWKMGLIQETPWWEKFWRWMREFPFVVPETITLEPDSLRAQAQALDADVWTHMPEEGTDQQIEWLEAKVVWLRDRTDEIESVLKDEVSRLENEIEELQQQRQQAHQALEKKVEKLTRDGLTWEGIALSWLIIGRMMSGGWFSGIL